MDGISAFLSAIPAAAASPIALVAYLGALAAWGLIGWRVRQCEACKAFPDPLACLRILFPTLPPETTAEEAIRSKRHDLFFRGFLAICATLLVLVAMTFYEAHDRRARSDELVREILGSRPNAFMGAQTSPDSQFMSSVNVLANGPKMVAEAAAEIKDLGPGDIEDIVQSMRRERRTASQINKALADISGAGRLKRVNDSLRSAAAVVNQAFKRLAECFGAKECTPGSEHEKMCRMARAIESNIEAINEQARRIKGVSFSSTAEPPMLGSGSMDAFFIKVNAPNVVRLANNYCQ